MNFGVISDLHFLLCTFLCELMTFFHWFQKKKKLGDEARCIIKTQPLKVN